jgi:pimeloyl-ACP methyl ester carboxylesterase
MIRPAREPATPSILDHPVISERYFFPRQDVLRGAFMVTSGDVQLACYHHAPHRDTRTVVYFHGNGEIVSDCVDLLAEPFARIGLNVFFAEYRGYGMSTGMPSLVAMLADVPRMIQALDLPEERLILFGRSVGSIYALHATSHFPGVAGLVVESGVADPLERILLRVTPEELGVTKKKLQSEVDARLNHRKLLEKFDRPALFMHTRHDGLIDLDHAVQMHRWAGGPKRLVVFDRGDHNLIFLANFDAYMREVQEFARSLE